MIKMVKYWIFYIKYLFIYMIIILLIDLDGLIHME